jgi:uncharacterized membrane protein YfcA
MYLGPIKWIASRRRPLKRRKSTALAVLAGLLVGGLGVGLYLRSFLDCVIATTLTMLALMSYAATASFAALVLTYGGAAVYAFHRVRESNARLAAATPA